MLETLGARPGKRLPVHLALEARTTTPAIDPVRFKQVFWNLFRNAIKFTPDGGHDRGALLEQRFERPSWRVEVSDDGNGFDRRSPTLFEPFEQAEYRRRSWGPRAGAGHQQGADGATRRAYRRQQPGPGTGARFVVEIETTSWRRPQPGRAGPPRPPEANRRILLVEDHTDTAESLAELSAQRATRCGPAAAQRRWRRPRRHRRGGQRPGAARRERHELMRELRRRPPAAGHRAERLRDRGRRARQPGGGLRRPPDQARHLHSPAGDHPARQRLKGISETSFLRVARAGERPAPCV